MIILFICLANRYLILKGDIYDQAKCIIINSDNFDFKIVEKFDQNGKKMEKNFNFFATVQLQNDKNQNLNLFQCSQVFKIFNLQNKLFKKEI